MTHSKRILSVDFLRGLIVVLMIFMNNPGSWDHLFAPLAHSHWNGCTVTDLIFPAFIFIVGASIAFALQTKKQHESSHNELILKIFKRGIIIVSLGILKDNFPYFIIENGEIYPWLPAEWRFLGVLQRIGLVYIITAILFLKSNLRAQIVVVFITLFGYWYLLNIEICDAFVKDLSQPGYHNFGAWLDVKLLGKNHLWKYSRDEGWDPESLLGTVSACASCVLGLICGQIIITQESKLYKIKKTFILGSALVVLGLIWSIVFPINKTLWSSSYVLFCAGVAALFTSLCLWLIDYNGITSFTQPFQYFGANAIFAYLGSEILSATLSLIPVANEESLGEFLANKVLCVFTSDSYSNINTTHNDFTNAQIASHFYALVIVIPFYFVLKYMYKRKIFVKV